MRPAEHWRTSRMAKIQTTRLPLRTVTAWRLWSGCWGRLVTRTSLTPSQVRGTSQDTQTVHTWRWCTSQRYCTSVEGGFIIKYGISAFFYPPQVRCGTCHPTTLWKWRLWTMHCMPSRTRWWCLIQAGSEGSMEQEQGRRTASPDILSGRRPSPTQQAAWGMEGFNDREDMDWGKVHIDKRGKWKLASSTDWQSSGMYEEGSNELAEQKEKHRVHSCEAIYSTNNQNEGTVRIQMPNVSFSVRINCT